ncbi:ERC protein 2, partial [Ophiophagus hannah]
QEALLAAISEKDANIALLELSASKKKKTQEEVMALKREKDRLVHQLKQQKKEPSAEQRKVIGVERKLTLPICQANFDLILKFSKAAHVASSFSTLFQYAYRRGNTYKIFQKNKLLKQSERQYWEHFPVAPGKEWDCLKKFELAKKEECASQMPLSKKLLEEKGWEFVRSSAENLPKPSKIEKKNPAMQVFLEGEYSEIHIQHINSSVLSEELEKEAYAALKDEKKKIWGGALLYKVASLEFIISMKLQVKHGFETAL